MRGRYLLGLSNANRQAAGVVTGDEVEVDLEFDPDPPVVVEPADFTRALNDNPVALAAYERLSHTVGVPPAETGLAPVGAVAMALDRDGLYSNQVALWEINEAFASVSDAVTKLLELDDSTVNVLGSGCSLGHPIGMTGARMVISLVHELARLRTDGVQNGRSCHEAANRDVRRPIPRPRRTQPATTGA